MIECIKTMAKIEIKLKKNDTELSNVTINKKEFENKENMSERMKNENIPFYIQRDFFI